MGGVFLNVNYKKTEQAFIDLGVDSFNHFFKQDHSSRLFEDLENGAIEEDAFYTAFRKEAKVKLSNLEIRNAWNAMVGYFPSERLVWLEEIKHKYNIYLYSNTNQIHYDCLMGHFKKDHPGLDFNQFFIKAYYSHEVGLRKPYVSSYQKILELAGLKAADTLFIDDTLKNVEGAEKAGMPVIYLKPPMTVLDLDL